MKKTVLGGLSVAVVALAGVTVWFLNTGDAAPSTVTAAASTTVSTLGETVETSTPEGEASVWQLAEGTTAFFILSEELRGQPADVAGVSDIVTGQVSFDPSSLGGADVGEILINARALTTGSSLRDRSVKGPILDTEVHEFIRFVPTAVDGLPESVGIGDEITFVITGDLTIRDVTRSVTFETVAVMTGADRVEGLATTTVLSSDFELVIPSVPLVANVSDEVVVGLEFILAPVA